MSITIRITSNYGKEAIYPVCNTAKTFANIASTKTMSRGLLEQIKSLGYTIITQNSNI